MKNCLLVGAAPSTNDGLKFILDKVSFDYIIAVDGGYDTLGKLGIEPDATFGDFDSLGYVPATINVHTADSHKDFTDMDWALNYAHEHDFDNIVLCNAFTGRLDHTIGNLQLLVQAAHHGACVWGVTEEEIVVPLLGAQQPTNPGTIPFSVFKAMRENETFSCLHFAEGAWGTMSALSHSDIAEGVCETGFEYGLEDALVLNKAVWGVSNELIGQPASISLKKGSLWAFFPLTALESVSYGDRGHCLIEQ